MSTEDSKELKLSSLTARYKDLQLCGEKLEKVSVEINGQEQDIHFKPMHKLNMAEAGELGQIDLGSNSHEALIDFIILRCVTSKGKKMFTALDRYDFRMHVSASDVYSIVTTISNRDNELSLKLSEALKNS